MDNDSAAATLLFGVDPVVERDSSTPLFGSAPAVRFSSRSIASHHGEKSASIVTGGSKSPFKNIPILGWIL